MCEISRPLTHLVAVNAGQPDKQSVWGCGTAQALLRRLKDDSMKVAAVAAGLHAVTTLPPAALLDALEALMYRASDAMAGITKAKHKHARVLARQVCFPLFRRHLGKTWLSNIRSLFL